MAPMPPAESPSTPDPPRLPPDAGTAGPPDSTDALFGLLYRELHGLAERHLRRQGAGFTLGTTTLLHELYLELADRTKLQFPDRARFLGYASRAMRGLVIDYARRRSTAKRGGEFHLLPLDDERAPDPGKGPGDPDDLEELSAALDRLSAVDPALTELVDLHFFCGLAFVEVARLRGVSNRTVLRDWRKARVFLHRVLRPDLLQGELAP
jgi:RNA polymerase sigma factor (TIGR02999 family)